jgi:hypothetical protein
VRKLLLLAFVLWAGVAEAQSICSGYINTGLVPMGYEAITVSSTAIGFTAGTIDTGTRQAVVAVATLETDSIRIRVDGGLPTSSVGQLVTQASNVGITVCGTTAIKAFRAIRTSTDASLKVTYFTVGN